MLASRRTPLNSYCASTCKELNNSIISIPLRRVFIAINPMMKVISNPVQQNSIGMHDSATGGRQCAIASAFILLSEGGIPL